MPKYYNEADAMLWVQPDGINTVCEVLSCHDMADLAIPQGDVERSFCIDPATGRYVLGSRRQGPPGAPTTTFTAHVGRNKDWLEHVMGCPTTFYLHKVPCGDRRLFLNYERGWTLCYGMVTARTLSAMATMMATGVAGESMQAFDMDVGVVKDTFQLVLTALVSNENVDANDVSFCNPAVCAGYCGPAKDVCAEGVVVYDADTDAVAYVDYTVNGGVTWTGVAGPFASNEHISSVVCFPVGDGSATRWIVSRGVTDAGDHAEIGWTDDSGANWHLVDVGAVDDSYHLWNGSLFALDHRHIWSGLDNGDIFFSGDGGLTWTEQSPGITTAGINYIRFVDENFGLAVCAANTIVLFTRDGGAHWNVLAGPAGGSANLLCCEIFDAHRAWIGDATGHLFYTDVLDEGMVAGDWAERLLDTPTGAVSQERINDIMFVREASNRTDDHCGYLVTSWTGAASAKYGAIYRTFNGGFDWEIWYTVQLHADGYPGLNAVWACGQNLAYAVGAIQNAVALATIITVNGALP